METIDWIFKSFLFTREISPFALALILFTSILMFEFSEESNSMEPFSALNSRESALIFTTLSSPPSFPPEVAKYALPVAVILMLLISEYG